MIAYPLLPLLLVAFTHQVAIFASRPLVPLTVILVTEAAPGEQVGNALALRLLGNRVGSIAGSILFGGLAAWIGLARVPAASGKATERGEPSTEWLASFSTSFG